MYDLFIYKLYKEHDYYETLFNVLCYGNEGFTMS